MTDLDVLHRAVDRLARARHAVLERACEEALQSGDRGVKVEIGRDGSYSARPSPQVPFGTIHEFLVERAS